MLYDARHAAPHHHFGHRVIILNRGSVPRAREQKENDANFPDQDVQRHSMTSHGTERLLVNDPSGGGLRGNCRVSYLSFVYGSTGGVCGRSLTVGKILFTGRQTCSLYLVLWLCDFGSKWSRTGGMRRAPTDQICLDILGRVTHKCKDRLKLYKNTEIRLRK